MRSIGIALATLSAVVPALGSTPLSLDVGKAYTGQTAPQSGYFVVGFADCATPGAQLEYEAANGTWHLAGSTTPSGSFRFEVPYGEVGGTFAVRLSDSEGTSAPVTFRTDYPMTGGLWLPPNERGWNNITTASLLETHKETWSALHDKARRRERVERRLVWLAETGVTRADVDAGRVSFPDSLAEPVLPVPASDTPEDLVVYGFAPEGTRATCVVGASGLAFETEIESDGRFEITIPSDAVQVSANGLPTFLINVTTFDNRLFSAHAWGELSRSLPRWVHARARGQYEDRLEALTGTQLPALHFPGISALYGAEWPSEGVSVTKVWASWCGPCIRQLHELDEFSRTAESQALSILSVSIDDEVQRAARVLEREGVELPHAGIDIGGNQIRDWLERTTGSLEIALPLTVVAIDGKVLVVRTGIIPIEAILDELRSKGVI